MGFSFCSGSLLFSFSVGNSTSLTRAKRHLILCIEMDIKMDIVTAVLNYVLFSLFSLSPFLNI